MAELIPTGPAQGGSLLQPLGRAAGGSMGDRLKAFAAQPPVKKALPWFGGVAGIGLLALVWSTLAPAPQRMLYSTLGDGERAEVVAALESGSIGYQIDNSTGAITVNEDDLYRARMLVASNGALATPESGTEMLDSLPLGASRTLEGDRLRSAQERELTLTIGEIDGVEAVRVHLAKADPSVFVRESIPPSASVMVRMARGRSLSQSNVTAIANLVAGSVPGLSVDAVRIVDQHGKLLSDMDGTDSDRLDLQARMEAKLRSQLDQLLSPMIGAGNFSSEVQVELDMDEVTSARESYDKDGAVRRETVQESQTAAGAAAAGVPGVLSNTPPPATEAEERAPADGEAQEAEPARQGESSSSRTYELGREVAVSNIAPGSIKRLSVAVAVSEEAMNGAEEADLERVKELVAAAVGANDERGDNIAVIMRPFQAAEMEAAPFWEEAWFAMVVRNAVALLSVLLVLFLVVRPTMKALTGRKASEDSEDDELETEGAPKQLEASSSQSQKKNAGPANEQLTSQIELAQRIAREKPEDALVALRKMLSESAPQEEPAR